MYLEHYGFEREPFNITPDSRFLFLSRRHREALASLRYGIDQRKGFIALTGDIGCGKTTICRALLKELDTESVRLALVLNPQVSDLELLQTINGEYGIEDRSASKRELLDALNAYLLEQYSRGRNCVLVIDESQRLSADALEQVRLISNLELEDQKLIQIALVGQPELDDILHLPELEQLNQRITVRTHIDPLDFGETKEYINHRLKTAGPNSKAAFSDDAIAAIFAHSGGVPRKTNVACDRALLITFVDGAQEVSRAHAEQAIEEVRGRRRTKPTDPKPAHRHAPEPAQAVAPVEVVRRPEPAPPEPKPVPAPRQPAAGSPAAPPAPAAPVTTTLDPPPRAGGNAWMIAAAVFAGLALIAAAMMVSNGGDRAGAMEVAVQGPASRGVGAVTPTPTPSPTPDTMTTPPREIETTPLATATVPPVETPVLTPEPIVTPDRELPVATPMVTITPAEPVATPSPTPTATPTPEETPAPTPSPTPEPTPTPTPTPSPTPTPEPTPTPTPTPEPTPTPTPIPTPVPWSYTAEGLMRVDRPQFTYAASLLTWTALGGSRLEEADLARLREMTPEEAAELKLVSGAAPLYLREAKLPPVLELLKPADLPVVIQVDSRVEGFGPWAVLLTLGDKGARLLDPLNGDINVPREDLANALTGISAPYSDPRGITGLQPLDSGDGVIALQERLVATGHLDGEVTGVLDPATEAALAAFQDARGLARSETVNEATAFALQTEAP